VCGVALGLNLDMEVYTSSPSMIKFLKGKDIEPFKIFFLDHKMLSFIVVIDFIMFIVACATSGPVVGGDIHINIHDCIKKEKEKSFVCVTSIFPFACTQSFKFLVNYNKKSNTKINTKINTKFTKGGIVGWIAGVALGVSDSYDIICPANSTSVHPEPIMKEETHASSVTPKKMVTKAIVVDSRHHHEDRPSQDRPSEEPDSPRDQRDASLENNSESDPEIQDYNPKHESMKSIRTF
jgi:hypothetical protein